MGYPHNFLPMPAELGLEQGGLTEGEGSVQLTSLL